jgi:hypothetical protein
MVFSGILLSDSLVGRLNREASAMAGILLLDGLVGQLNRTLL